MTAARKLRRLAGPGVVHGSSSSSPSLSWTKKSWCRVLRSSLWECRVGQVLTVEGTVDEVCMYIYMIIIFSSFFIFYFFIIFTDEAPREAKA